LQNVWNGGRYQSPRLNDFVWRLTEWCDHPLVFWILLILGGVRGVILLLAYPPAHGADSMAYFAYAEHLAGHPIPLIAEVVPPLYGMLIFVAYKVLGSIYWLIGLQFIMGAALAPIYYGALKRYSPTLAMIVALVILGDVQTGVVFNFISTEPLYIFLMALTFSLFLRQMEHHRLTVTDGLAGALVALMMLTRAVGRFLILPMVVVFWLRTRSFKRTLATIAGFGMVFVLNAGLTTLLVGQVDGGSSSNYMTLNVTREQGGVRVVPENGPNTARYLEIRDACEDKLYTCLERELGGWGEAMTLVTNFTLETIAANWQAYISRTWDKTLDFLSLSAQQVGIDEALPGEVQCVNPEANVQAMDREFLRRSSWAWSLADYSDAQLLDFQNRFRPIHEAMCPMLPASPALRDIVDAVSFRYRSLGRPQPHLWYGALLALVLLVPQIRHRYLTLVLTAGAMLLNHALISAVLANVQPRYVVVVNSMRIVLLVLLIFIVVKLAVNVLDGLLALTGQRILNRRENAG
jgi:hypothetical protein